MPSEKFSLSIIFAFISAILFSIQIFIVGRYHKHEEVSLCMTYIQLFVIVILFTLYVLIFESSTMFLITGTQSILPLTLLGVVATGIAYFFQTKASIHLTENSCNIVLSLESLFASLFSIIFGYDSLTWLFVVGVLIISAGITLYTIGDIKDNDFN